MRRPFARGFLHCCRVYRNQPRTYLLRYYGLLANCHRAGKLEVCRECLATPCAELLPSPADSRAFYDKCLTVSSGSVQAAADRVSMILLDLLRHLWRVAMDLAVGVLRQ